jgi:hypothetical protein
MKTYETIGRMLKLNFRGVDGPTLHGSGDLSYRVWVSGSSGEENPWVIVRFEKQLLEDRDTLVVGKALKAIRMAKEVLLTDGRPGRKGTIVISGNE